MTDGSYGAANPSQPNLQAKLQSPRIGPQNPNPTTKATTTTAPNTHNPCLFLSQHVTFPRRSSTAFRRVSFQRGRQRRAFPFTFILLLLDRLAQHETFFSGRQVVRFLHNATSGRRLGLVWFVGFWKKPLERIIIISLYMGERVPSMGERMMAHFTKEDYTCLD